MQNGSILRQKARLRRAAEGTCTSSASFPLKILERLKLRGWLSRQTKLQLYLNGEIVGNGSTVQRVSRTDLSGLLRAGMNEFKAAVEVSAVELGQSALISDAVVKNAAHPGLIASLGVRFRDGSRLDIDTNREWKCSSTESGPWAVAAERGPYDMPPWKLDDASIEQVDIYPSYAVTAELLGRMGVEPDFESDAPLRYIHRSDAGEEFYFIANGETQPQDRNLPFSRHRPPARMVEHPNRRKPPSAPILPGRRPHADSHPS